MKKSRVFLIGILVLGMAVIGCPEERCECINTVHEGVCPSPCAGKSIPPCTCTDPPPPTSDVTIGGCESRDCHELARAVRNVASREAFTLATGNNGIASDYCYDNHYNCEDPTLHNNSLTYSFVISGLIGHEYQIRDGKEYHERPPISQFMYYDFYAGEDKDLSVQNTWRDADTGDVVRTELVWPCFNDDDREKARVAYINRFKQLHPKKVTYDGGGNERRWGFCEHGETARTCEEEHTTW